MLLKTVAVLGAASMAAAVPIGMDKRDLLGQLLGMLGIKQRLTFKNGNFKIVNFSDMHFGERPGDQTWAAWGPENDANTQRVHATVMDQEHPDFIVYNGDFITGENTFKENSTKYVDQVVAPAVQRGLKWASTYGNHDNAINITHQAILEYEQQHYSWNSYTRSDVGPKPWGLANYWLPVFENEWDFAPAMLLWFFDSRSFVDGHGAGPGVGNQAAPAAAQKYWVDETTVPAYIKSQTDLMKLVFGHVPPSLVFVHIPFDKSDDVYSLPSAGDHDDEPDPSVQGFVGNDYTGLDALTFNQLAALNQNSGQIIAITSGHDHGENFCARSKDSSGIPLCFGGHSGYGGYTTPHSLVRNGRVFNVNINQLKQQYPSVDTWSSFENSTIGYKVTLNQNYMAQYN